MIFLNSSQVPWNENPESHSNAGDLPAPDTTSAAFLALNPNAMVPVIREFTRPFPKREI